MTHIGWEGAGWRQSAKRLWRQKKKNNNSPNQSFYQHIRQVSMLIMMHSLTLSRIVLSRINSHSHIWQIHLFCKDSPASARYLSPPRPPRISRQKPAPTTKSRLLPARRTYGPFGPLTAQATLPPQPDSPPVRPARLRLGPTLP